MKNSVRFILGISLFVFSVPSHAKPMGKIEWIAPDFFIEHVDTKIVKERKLGDENCREHISKAVCVVDPIEWGNGLTEPRPCLDGSASYAKPFEDLYDHLPAGFQKMFCSLNSIYVEKVLTPTAYAGLARDGNGNVSGAVMGIRKSLLDEPVPLEKWGTWKEQLSFGGSKDPSILDPNLPWISTHTESQVNDLLYMIVTHEFGHMFDFANDLNKTATCAPDPNDPDEMICEMAPDSYGALSWKTNMMPLQENEFLGRDRLCFYRCENGFVNRNEVNELYKEFYEKTNFISLYASTSPWDDLADSMAYVLMADQLSSSYVIDTKQGVQLDMMEKLRSDRFRPKVEYIHNFLNSDHIIYP